jgi:hypothetical protein
LFLEILLSFETGGLGSSTPVFSGFDNPGATGGIGSFVKLFFRNFSAKRGTFFVWILL